MSSLKRLTRILNYGRSFFSPWICAAGTLGIPLLVLAGRSSWPSWMEDLVVALSCALALPGWINILTRGWAKRSFGRVRYPLGWLIIYFILFTSAIVFRLRWPVQVPIIGCLLALISVVGLGYAEASYRRRLPTG